MVDKRPFVDRRLGLSLLYHSQPPSVLTRDTDMLVNRLNDILDDMGLSMFVTGVTYSGTPPQMRIIFNESAVQPEVILRVKREFTDHLEDQGANIQHISVVSLAFSPGDKVRNAMPV